MGFSTPCIWGFSSIRRREIDSLLLLIIFKNNTKVLQIFSSYSQIGGGVIGTRIECSVHTTFHSNKIGYSFSGPKNR